MSETSSGEFGIKLTEAHTIRAFLKIGDWVKNGATDFHPLIQDAASRPETSDVFRAIDTFRAMVEKDPENALDASKELFGQGLPVRAVFSLEDDSYAELDGVVTGLYGPTGENQGVAVNVAILDGETTQNRDAIIYPNSQHHLGIAYVY